MYNPSPSAILWQKKERKKEKGFAFAVPPLWPFITCTSIFIHVKQASAELDHLKGLIKVVCTQHACFFCLL